MRVSVSRSFVRTIRIFVRLLVMVEDEKGRTFSGNMCCCKNKLARVAIEPCKRS